MSAFDVGYGRACQPLEQPRHRGAITEWSVHAQQRAANSALSGYYLGESRQIKQLLLVYPFRTGVDPQVLGVDMLHA